MGGGGKPRRTRSAYLDESPDYVYVRPITAYEPEDLP